MSPIARLDREMSAGALALVALPRRRGAGAGARRALPLLLIVAHTCAGYNIFSYDDKASHKREFMEGVVFPRLERCAGAYAVPGPGAVAAPGPAPGAGAGVQPFGAQSLLRYAQRPAPVASPPTDLDILLDCAFACFFQQMGWLEAEGAQGRVPDMETAYQVSAVLRDQRRSLPRGALPAAAAAAARCNYVNLPRAPLPAPDERPMCEQGRRLRECLVLEADVPPMTEENKKQLEATVLDWLQVCAQEERARGARLLAYARRPLPRAHPRVACALKCLFQDLGWMDYVEPDEQRLLQSPVVIETVKLYYSNDDRMPEIIEKTAHCIQDANELMEDRLKYPAAGCHRAIFLLECAVTQGIIMLSAEAAP